ncbi:MAG: hypothetical protein APF84_08235 [Gracilibacter sp. BRH_c7a]|nr:MAG: hypothetical protein APF84_08235 [Gracilibacter sp. BRH_c7a]
MNLDYLKTFYTTVKENSISKTAKLLHMSQPGVSFQLQTLEKELGFQLLIRSNKGVVLTEAGKIVYDYAVSLLSIQKDIDRELNSLRTNIQETIVSSCTTVGSYTLPCSLYLFKRRYPNTKVILNTCNSDTVVENLVNKSCHIGIVEGKPNGIKIEYTKLASCDLCLVCSKNICKYRTVSVDELTELPLIIREKGSGSRQSLEYELQKLAISLQQMNTVLELTSSEAIKAAIFNGQGYAILPELSIKHELDSGSLKKIAIEDTEFKTDYFLAYTKESPPRGSEKTFYDFIQSSRRGFCS